MFHERWRPCETFASLRGRSFIHDNSHVVSNFNMLTVSKHERCTYAEVERGSRVRVYEFTRLFYIRRNVSSVFRAIFFVGQGILTSPLLTKHLIDLYKYNAHKASYFVRVYYVFAVPLQKMRSFVRFILCVGSTGRK